jgi:hypothetical protein
MPKMHKDFPAQLSLGVALEMRQKLTAIGYCLGSGGEYAGAVRNLLHEGIGRFIAGLDERRRADYETILANVKAREVLK